MEQTFTNNNKKSSLNQVVFISDQPSHLNIWMIVPQDCSDVESFVRQNFWQYWLDDNDLLILGDDIRKLTSDLLPNEHNVNPDYINKNKTVEFKTIDWFSLTRSSEFTSQNTAFVKLQNQYSNDDENKFDETQKLLFKELSK